MKLAIRMHEQDNVATAMETLRAAEEVCILSDRGAEVDRLAARTDVPLPYHKVALTDLAVGDALVKYGEVIGYATAPVARGDWVHLHNARSAHFAAAGQGEEG